MRRLLTAWRNSAEAPGLADAPVRPLQQGLKDLERAYSNFFEKRAAFPRFKGAGYEVPVRLHFPVMHQAEEDPPH
jgi:putative transposase